MHPRTAAGPPDPHIRHESLVNAEADRFLLVDEASLLLKRAYDARGRHQGQILLPMYLSSWREFEEQCKALFSHSPFTVRLSPLRAKA